MSNKAHHTFETPEQLHAWLRANHARETELWMRIYKKATGQPSVTWDDCVVAAIAEECAACRAADRARAHASRRPGALRILKLPVTP